MTYDVTTLNVTITDTITNASASQSYAVNIPSYVGGSYAYVGFTGATGGLTAVQSIKNWTFTPLPEGTSEGNLVAGNLIGTDVSGTIPLGNDTGVLITAGAAGNTLGGTFAGSGNIISGNLASGVDLEAVGTSKNTVEGNDIGTKLGATDALPNPTGVLIGGGASNNTIGAANVVNPDGSIEVLLGNIISGNESSGVHINGAGIDDSQINTSENMVEGNLIGTNASYAFLGDSVGVLIDDAAASNTIGAGNVIGGNPTAGIDISGIGSVAATSQNVIAGDFIGTDPTGLDFLGNGIGVLIGANATNNTVGGTVDQRNVISSNLGPGVDIQGSQFFGPTSGNTVAGNFIGTDATGTRVVNPDTLAGLYNPIGILLEAGASNNTIGGLNELSPVGTPQLSEGNLISGNPSAGIEITGSGSNSMTTGNLIEGNFIGTDSSGETTSIPIIPQATGPAYCSRPAPPRTRWAERRRPRAI